MNKSDGGGLGSGILKAIILLNPAALLVKPPIERAPAMEANVQGTDYVAQRKKELKRDQ